MKVTKVALFFFFFLTEIRAKLLYMCVYMFAGKLH